MNLLLIGIIAFVCALSVLMCVAIAKWDSAQQKSRWWSKQRQRDKIELAYELGKIEGQGGLL